MYRKKNTKKGKLLPLRKKVSKKEKLNKTKYNNISKEKIIYRIIILLLIIIIFIILLYVRKNENKKNIILSNEEKHFNNTQNEFDMDLDYHNYEREIITDKMKNLAHWQLNDDEPYFLNGIIRKFKPKKCLEIGVAYGGSAIIILNAIKDIKDSFLISLDLNTDLFNKVKLKTGCNVEKYFPELASNNKWQLYTGEQPHKFLDKLNMKFDFLFLDTSHLTPGEIINIIEAFPFLEENAIVVLHDVLFHLPSHGHYKPKEIKFHPSQIYLMTSLSGNKVVIPDNRFGAENIGAVFLNPNQEKYYLNYFFLLMSPWDYMPTDSQIEELRVFIKKYYKKDKYLNLFNKAVEENKMYLENFKHFQLSCANKFNYI